MKLWYRLIKAAAQWLHLHNESRAVRASLLALGIDPRELAEARRDALAMFAVLMNTCSREELQSYRENPGRLARDAAQGREQTRRTKQAMEEKLAELLTQPGNLTTAQFQDAFATEPEGALFSPPEILQRLKVTVSEDRQSVTISPEYGFAPAHERGTAAQLKPCAMKPRPFIGNEENINHRSTSSGGTPAAEGETRDEGPGTGDEGSCAWCGLDWSVGSCDCQRGVQQ